MHTLLLVHAALAGATGVPADAPALSPADEFALGQRLYGGAAWTFGLVRDQDKLRRAERITRGVVAGSDRPDLVYQVQVVHSPEVNASALPGGFVTVFEGALDRLDDGELAFVLGHEIAHVLLHHGTTQDAVTQASNTFAQIVGPTLDPAQRVRAREVFTLHSKVTVCALSRHLELEADLYGMLFMIRSGYGSDHALAAMEALRPYEPPEPDQADADHPSVTARLAAMQAALLRIDETAAQFDAGVLALRGGRPREAALYLDQFLTLFPASSSGWANEGLAWLSAAAEDDNVPYFDSLDPDVDPGLPTRAPVDYALFDRAERAFQQALTIDPRHPLALEASAVLARHRGDNTTARALLERVVALDGTTAGRSLNLGNAYAGDKQWARARAQWARAARDPAFTNVVAANRAWMLEERGRTAAAVKAWTAMAQLPGFASVAGLRLVALGQPMPTGMALPTEHTFRSIGPFALGMTADAVREAAGKEDVRLRSPDGSTTVLVWRAQAINAQFRESGLEALGTTSETHRLSNDIGVGTRQDDVIEKLGRPEFTRVEGGGVMLLYPSRNVGVVCSTETRLVMEIVLKGVP